MAKKNSKRGFTLVELIVVLVILAILAALLIPALTGYIDKARKNQVVAETRALTQAVQTEMSTIYGLNNSFQGQKDIGKPLTIASKDGDYGEGKGQLVNQQTEEIVEILSENSGLAWVHPVEQIREVVDLIPPKFKLIEAAENGNE